MGGRATTGLCRRSLPPQPASDGSQGANALLAAVQRLKERLSAGLSMEDALLSSKEDSDPAYKLAVKLWFEMEF
jgi:hypothetical protein